LRIEELLCPLNARLRQLQGFGGNFFDYHLLTEEYVKEVRQTIDDALASCVLDEEMEYHLVFLYEVYRGGNIIMG